MSFFWARRGPSPSRLASHPLPPAPRRPLPRCQAPTPPPPAAASATKVRAAPPPPARPHVTRPGQWERGARGPGSGSAREGMDAAVGSRRREGAGASVPPPLNPPTLSPAGSRGPSRLQFPSGAPAVRRERPSPGLGLGAARRPRPGADLGPRLARPGVLPGSRWAGGGNGLGWRKESHFNPVPGIKRMRSTDPFSPPADPHAHPLAAPAPGPRSEKPGRSRETPA